MSNKVIKKLANNIRLDLLKMIFNSQSSHIASSLSIVDLLVVLYGKKIIKFNPNKPNLSGRDIFILSKGHAAAALYAVLANVGYFSKRKTILLTRGTRFLRFAHRINRVLSSFFFLSTEG